MYFKASFHVFEVVQVETLTRGTACILFLNMTACRQISTYFGLHEIFKNKVNQLHKMINKVSEYYIH